MEEDSHQDFPLRLAKRDDRAELETLIALSARTLQAGFYSERQIEGALGTVFGVDTQLIADGTYFVIERAGRIVACGGWSKRKTLYGADAGKIEADALLDPRRDAARIRAFFIHPEFARRGLGRRLMEASVAAARAAGYGVIDIVATLPGERLYAAFGFAVVERYEIALGNGEPLPVVKMTRRY